MDRYEWVVECFDDEIDELLASFKDNPTRLKHMEWLADQFFDCLQRDNCEYGGWGLNSKRPFGNSSVELDIAEILGFEINDVLDENGDLKDEFANYLNSLYDDLGVFLRYKWLEFKKTK